MMIGLRCLVGAVLVTVVGISTAHAADLPVVVDCPSWSGEAAGQVEARIRAALQAEELIAAAISVTCEPEDAVSVRVASRDWALTRLVARQSEHVEDDVVWTVEATLDQLKRSITITMPPEVQAPTLPGAPPTAPPQPPAALSQSAPPPRRDQSELTAQLQIERLSSLWAPGAEAALVMGSDSLRAGLALGGRRALGGPSEFSVSELSGRACVSLSPPQLVGLRFELGLGLSVLTAGPRGGTLAPTATALTAGFTELDVGRPFWFGSVAVSPALGARAFLAPRSIHVDGKELFALPLLVPHVGLALIYRR